MVYSFTIIYHLIMKRILVFFYMLFLLMTVSAQDGGNIPVNQHTTSKKNIIKTSMVFPFGRIFNISYERMVGKDVSIVVELLVGEGNVGVSPQLRYYLSENMVAPSGTFLSPVVIFASEIMGAGLVIGRQRVFKDKISIDAYLGPAYYTEGMAVWGGINVGIAF